MRAPSRVGQRARAPCACGARACVRGACVAVMSALFDFRAFLTVLLLFICTCTFVREKAPQLVDKRTGYDHG